MSEEPRLPAGARRRVVVVAADAAGLARQRMPLLRAITMRGHRLLCLVGDADDDSAAALGALGAEIDTFDLGPPQLRAHADRRVFDAVASRLLEWRPYALLGLGLKPMVAAALASRRAPCPRVVLVSSSLEGLAGGRAERPGLAVQWVVRRALRSAHVLVMHNAGQALRFHELALLPKTLAMTVVPGAGVDLVRHEQLPLPDVSAGITFAMISRPDSAADIADFGEAARRLGASGHTSRFVLSTLPASHSSAGPVQNTMALPEGVEFVEAPAGVRDVLAECHVLVHLSDADGFAHEAVEALACGRPVITIDAPGCREVVDERVNGVIVPRRDPVALARAMESFLRRPEQLEWMSRASRSKAERRFDANAMAMDLLGLMGLVENG